MLCATMAVVMPLAPPTPCAQPGCPELTRRERFCIQHKKAHNQRIDQARRPSRKLAYGRNWRKRRLVLLGRDPVCHAVLPGGAVCRGAATEVDHIVPLADGGSNRDSNLQTMCKGCHSRKTMAELRAGRLHG